MYATDPDNKRRPSPGRKRCPHCEATPGGCQANHWLRGRSCCERCTGDHDGGAPDAKA